MTESPAYTLEEKDNHFEIRKYPDYILAQVDVESDYNSAVTIGFRILANYIFGGNKKRKSIPMTTPVSEEKIKGSEKIPMASPVTHETVKSEKIPMASPVTQESSQESEKISMTTPVSEETYGAKMHRISFTMPSKYSLETLPEPDDPRIKFKEVENQRMAVLRFSGRVKKKLAYKKMEEMRKWLAKKKLNPRSNFIVAQYNNPAVPGFLRRNEILVEIG
ncbi:MAG: heme-binding protein [Methanobacterium sp.]|uniref:SOUL family heme-binding protein n=1 Tax=Methanobacterium sp. TaxID=2164 RepID=UPI003C735118